MKRIPTKLSKKEDIKINQAINFLEEMMWLIESRKASELREIPLLIRSLVDQNSYNSGTSKYLSLNQNKNMLVGILPNFLQDIEIFKTNIDIADFAKNTLKIAITRPEKRSKYELIGLISCEVNSLNDSDLSALVESLITLTNNSDGIYKLKEAKKSLNFSWNEFLENI